MKPREYPSIDGFVRRRSNNLIRPDDSDALPQRFLDDTPSETIARRRDIPLPRPQVGESRTELADALRAIDDEPIPERHIRRVATPERTPERRARRFKKKFVLIPLFVILGIIFAVGGYLGIRAYLATSHIFNGGSILSLITPGTPLKTDAQGRTNIVVFGTSQDDSAHQNASGGGGLWLTDSIELISIDQKQKTMKMVGIPRDLWVSIDNCDVGSYAKINAVYECASGLENNDGNPGPNYKSQDEKGGQALMKTIAEVTGITPQYYVHGDYSVLKQAVDAVGGIDVNIVGDGASGIYDTNFDWDCPKGPYTCKNVYYPHNGTYHLDGTQALFLSRARADAGSYSYKDFGLAQGDFDRQANQQKVLKALMSKVENGSTLANPLAVDSLISAFGNNFTMSLSGGEIKTLISFAKSLPQNNISQVSLVKPGSSVVTTGEADGQSIVEPTSGLYDFSSIINYLTTQLSTNPAVAEDATVGVYNASGRVGAASKEEVKLQQLGLNVDTTANASSSDAGSGTFTLYDESNGKMPKTLAQLESSLGVKATTGSLPSDIAATSTDDFVVVVNQ